MDVSLEWVACAEQLPEPDKRVLVWERYSESPFVGFQSGGTWFADCEHHDAEGGWGGAVVISHICQDLVSHWMPLPEPPHE